MPSSQIIRSQIQDLLLIIPFCSHPKSNLSSMLTPSLTFTLLLISTFSWVHTGQGRPDMKTDIYIPFCSYSKSPRYLEDSVAQNFTFNIPLYIRYRECMEQNLVNETFLDVTWKKKNDKVWFFYANPLVGWGKDRK